MDKYTLEEIRDAFGSEAEFEDMMIAGFGMDPQTMSEQADTPRFVKPEQPVSLLTAVLVIGMVFLCIVLVIGGT